MRASEAVVAAAVAAASAVMLAAIVSTPAAEGLRAPAMAELAETGVSNPVTAVLLDYRGYDTFLELVVVALAVVGTGAAAPEPADPAPMTGPVARAAAALLVPAILLVAGYLLWTGSSRPGGAFQAGALLAGGLVLLEATSDGRPAWRLGAALRIGAAAGAAAFLLAGLGALAVSGRFLDYPGPAAAYAMILAVESAAAVSIAICLSALFAAAPYPARRAP